MLCNGGDEGLGAGGLQTHPQRPHVGIGSESSGVLLGDHRAGPEGTQVRVIAHDSERTDLQTEVEEGADESLGCGDSYGDVHLSRDRIDRVELTSVNPSLNQRTTSHHGLAWRKGGLRDIGRAVGEPDGVYIVEAGPR